MNSPHGYPYENGYNHLDERQNWQDPLSFMGGLLGLPGFQSPGYPGYGYPGYPSSQQPWFPPGQQPGFPPGQQPGFPGGPSFPGGGPDQGQAGPPSSPPPNFTPQKDGQVGVKAVDPGSIRGCLYRYTYVWLDNRQRFWFYPVYVGRRSISGYRWTGFTWVYYGVDLRRIESFQCY
ncbi:hypothetical protein ACLIA0_10190 [Bacillaceae bacterium W0354]